MFRIALELASADPSKYSASTSLFSLPIDRRLTLNFYSGSTLMYAFIAIWRCRWSWKIMKELLPLCFLSAIDVNTGLKSRSIWMWRSLHSYFQCFKPSTESSSAL